MEPEPFSIDDSVHETMDTVLIPLVGWTREGYRVGFGGGFYDQFLKDFKGLRIGIGWEMGQIEKDRLQFESWDQKMNVIISEQSVFEM